MARWVCRDPYFFACSVVINGGNGCGGSGGSGGSGDSSGCSSIVLVVVLVERLDHDYLISVCWCALVLSAQLQLLTCACEEAR